MPSNIYDVSHFREGGQDIIVTFCASQVETLPPAGKDALRDMLEACAHNQGLGGATALAWKVGSQWKMWAPPHVKSILQRLAIEDIALNINWQLTCG